MLKQNPLLVANNIQVNHGTKVAVKNFSLSLQPGKVVALCGPNGCGKTTALHALRGLLPRKQGEILLLSQQLLKTNNKDTAKKIAMLTQYPEAPNALTVREVVMMGRYAHRNGFSSPSTKDNNAVENALATMALGPLAERPIATLSGGQRQRTWIALIIAQASPVVLLDEPTNHLDIAHALNTLTHIRRMADEEHKAIAIVLHDLNLAARFADELILMKNGEIQANGLINDTFTAQNIGHVFDIECEVITTSGSEFPHCIAYSSLA
ncbi:ABC transporter ATP-binding protein [Reinekea sp.]|jgi:iron complex transport system ATP-binding protein|uniref:ABC transporter ATP-binding protein n=1 Tax=Reinekea sp. TaxID=1970455 RepID=UPI00398A0032